MTTLDTLVVTTASFAASKAIIKCMRELRLRDMDDAATVLGEQYEKVCEYAKAEAAELSQGLAQLTHADIITEAMR